MREGHDVVAPRPGAAGPRVSVVVPCYNAAAFLAEAIASVRAQTYPVDEILVVDDASCDRTVAVAERLGTTVIRQAENRGPSAARNVGIACAAGDVIAFLDADDAWLPWHLELCVQALCAQPDAAVACTEPILWDAPTPAPPTPAPPSAARCEVPADPAVLLLDTPFVSQSAAVVRRSVMIEVGGYDEQRRYGEDYDLWLRIAARHAIVRVRAPGLKRRLHPGQASRAVRHMVESGFELRLRTLEAVRAGGDATRAARAEAAACNALDADLHTTWYVSDAASFAHLLTLAADVPAVAAVRRRWALRGRFGWHIWHAARAAKRRLSVSRRSGRSA